MHWVLSWSPFPFLLPRSSSGVEEKMLQLRKSWLLWHSNWSRNGHVTQIWPMRPKKALGGTLRKEAPTLLGELQESISFSHSEWMRMHVAPTTAGSHEGAWWACWVPWWGFWEVCQLQIAWNCASHPRPPSSWHGLWAGHAGSGRQGERSWGMSTAVVGEKTPGSSWNWRQWKQKGLIGQEKNKGTNKQGTSLDWRTGSVEARIQGRWCRGRSF